MSPSIEDGSPDELPRSMISVTLIAGFALRAMRDVRALVPAGLAEMLPVDGKGVPRTQAQMPYKPLNIYTLAAAMGLPDVTVRRKVQHLIQRGWLTRGVRGSLAVKSIEVRARAAALNAASISDVNHACAALRASGIPMS